MTEDWQTKHEQDLTAVDVRRMRELATAHLQCLAERRLAAQQYLAEHRLAAQFGIDLTDPEVQVQLTAARAARRQRPAARERGAHLSEQPPADTDKPRRA